MTRLGGPSCTSGIWMTTCLISHIIWCFVVLGRQVEDDIVLICCDNYIFTVAY